MRKRILIALAIAVVCIIVSGTYYYHYNYVEKVTERYLMKFTPPQEHDGYFGTTYTEPKISISKLKDYESDSVAVEGERKNAEAYFSKLLDQFEKENFNDSENDGASALMKEAKINAYKDMLAETRSIIAFTHVRNTDLRKAIDIIKKHGLASDEVRKFAEKNKMHIETYPLN